MFTKQHLCLIQNPNKSVNSIVSVSYTHLDVYKRQHIHTQNYTNSTATVLLFSMLASKFVKFRITSLSTSDVQSLSGVAHIPLVITLRKLDTWTIVLLSCQFHQLFCLNVKQLNFQHSDLLSSFKGPLNLCIILMILFAFYSILAYLLTMQRLQKLFFLQSSHQREC